MMKHSKEPIKEQADDMADAGRREPDEASAGTARTEQMVLRGAGERERARCGEQELRGSEKVVRCAHAAKDKS